VFDHQVIGARRQRCQLRQRAGRENDPMPHL
jgi:hypothetical protein